MERFFHRFKFPSFPTFTLFLHSVLCTTVYLSVYLYHCFVIRTAMVLPPFSFFPFISRLTTRHRLTRRLQTIWKLPEKAEREACSFLIHVAAVELDKKVGRLMDLEPSQMQTASNAVRWCILVFVLRGFIVLTAVIFYWRNESEIHFIVPLC